MSTVRVVRLENDKQEGVYTCGAVEDISASWYRPRTEEDNLDEAGYLTGLHYGFADVAAMNEWFDLEALSYMLHYGVRLSTYEVPVEHVKYGVRQLVFALEHATLVDTMDIDVVIEHVEAA